MKRVPWGLVVPLLVAMMAVVALLIFIQPIPPTVFAETTVYISSGNLYHNVFREPFETAIIQFECGDWYSFTTKDEFSIGIGAGYIREFLRLQGRKISDIQAILHNHFQNPQFSPADKRVYRDLVRMGFKGAFLMLHTPSRTIYKLVDGETVKVGVVEKQEDLRRYFEEEVR